MKDILTEEEAKERWCPLARDEGDDNASAAINRNADGTPFVSCFCIASKCMAWRLAHKPAASGEETGFCGAFGIPRHT